MNLNYLGDALDHWKGSLLQYLLAAGALDELAVDPMATDAPWVEDDFSVYARLLHIEPRQIIRHKAPLTPRDHYFREIEHARDLFLDPDTGIATSRPKREHVRPKDVNELLRSPSRLVAVYQHIRVEKTSERVDACVRAVNATAGWCSYESRTVAMLFFCGDARRTQMIFTALRRLLGKHTEGKVRCDGREARHLR